MKNLYLCFFLLFLFIASDGFAQTQTTKQVSAETDSTIYRMQTKDGNQYTGKIISQNDLGLVLRTEKLGDITIAKADIKSMESISKNRMLRGEYLTDNPQSTRYLFSPNGYGLKKGEGYYQNAWLFFNQVAVGVTNNFSIGAGVVPLFLFAGESTPIWITPKFSIPVVKDKINLGVGALAGVVVGESNAGFGVLYGTSTFGSQDRNLSVGIGWGYGGGEMATTPTFSLSGMTRLSQKWYLMSENYYIDLGDTKSLVLSGGARVLLANKIGLDFGLFIPADQDGWVALPWLGLTVPFGSKYSPSGKLK